MDYTPITERVFIGAAISSPDDITQLVRAGVTHIVDARAEFDDAAGVMASDPGMHYLFDPTDDDGQPKPEDWFKRCLDFAMLALAVPGNVVLTVCGAGHNRAPSLAYAILRAQGWPAAAAMNLIHIMRPATIGGVRYAPDAERALLALNWVRAVPATGLE